MPRSTPVGAEMSGSILMRATDPINTARRSASAMSCQRFMPENKAMVVPDFGSETNLHPMSIYALGRSRRRTRVRSKSTAAGHRVTGPLSQLSNRIL